MTKLFVSLPALALVVALSGSATAENGAISSATLNEMGLASMQIMSDEEALAVRGLGWLDDYEIPTRHAKKPWSLAFGVSFAGVEFENNNLEGKAGTKNGFFAKGKFMAMGEHLSEALITKSTTKELWVKGVLATKRVYTKSVGVAAGGGASASSL